MCIKESRRDQFTTHPPHFLRSKAKKKMPENLQELSTSVRLLYRLPREKLKKVRHTDKSNGGCYSCPNPAATRTDLGLDMDERAEGPSWTVTPRVNKKSGPRDRLTRSCTTQCNAGRGSRAWSLQ